VALVIGILILIFPRFLNYFVALYTYCTPLFYLHCVT
jgi:hypothetical protein